MLRDIAREVSESVDRTVSQVDVDGIAETIGVDPDRAREWVDMAAGMLRAQAERVSDEMAGRAHNPAPAPERAPERTREPGEDPLASAAPHPLDIPTETQGVALAALDSGRWTVEPGTKRLTTHGEGPGPNDALGLVRELHARDWIAADGEVTLVGRHALSRWLDSQS
jgi:hypothetical protein